MILKVRLSRESILKIIAKASLAVLVVAGVFGTPTVHAFRNYSEYAAACRAEGGTPSPSPARCDMPSARGGGSSGSGCPAPCDGGLLGDLLRGIFKPGSSAAEQADQQSRAANEKGVQAYKKGDWAAAISLFQQALQNDPNDPTYRQNLANAQANMANQQEREKAEREAMDRQRQNKVAADNMQQSIQNFAQTLNAAPVSGGLDFDGRTAGTAPSVGNSGGLDFTASVTIPSQKKPVPVLPSGDPMVVDARGPRDGAHLTNQVPELKNSPAADRISKGFQAVINHDWPVALAWWQDALKRDPNNAVLKRSVDLAQWMVDKRKATAAGPVTPLGAAIHSASRGDNAGAIRQFELAKAENPAIAAQADAMINALRQRQTKDANDAKSAAYWSAEINKGTQKMVDEMFETGMNRLSIGDEKGAQAAFNDATFFGGMSNLRPSQLSAPKSGKSPESAPVFKTLPDGRVLQLPTDSDVELLFPFDPSAQAPAPKTGKAK
ncbi:tetratricopeptide repeat protein [Polaromonas sp.]|uniref:tetratricopeptide repeat protein n=1 Tax=Polaromonas sp. TaxID=1869339 RepID=UPI002FCA18B8